MINQNRSDNIVCSDQYRGLHWRISSGEGAPTGENGGHDLGGRGHLQKLLQTTKFY